MVLHNVFQLNLNYYINYNNNNNKSLKNNLYLLLCIYLHVVSTMKVSKSQFTHFIFIIYTQNTYKRPTDCDELIYFKLFHV